MDIKLHYNSTSQQLQSTLKTLMAAREFNAFRLVGGTALGLLRGHRESVDIDLFSDVAYETIDFEAINAFLCDRFPYVDTNENNLVGLGKSYYIGDSESDCVKLDLFYTDKFIHEFSILEGIRLATVEEIIAMKIDVISRGGRKKDFWDIHELKDDYTLEKMLALHKQRYPYTHDEDQIKINFTNFQDADDDFDPICLHGKHWEIIKLDLIDFAG